MAVVDRSGGIAVVGYALGGMVGWFSTSSTTTATMISTSTFYNTISTRTISKTTSTITTTIFTLINPPYCYIVYFHHQEKKTIMSIW